MVLEGSTASSVEAEVQRGTVCTSPVSCRITAKGEFPRGAPENTKKKNALGIIQGQNNAHGQHSII